MIFYSSTSRVCFLLPYTQFFPSFGKFKGKVVSYNKVTGLYGVEYDDGDNEDVSENELDTIAVVKPKDSSAKKRKSDEDSLDPITTPKKKAKNERFKRKYRNGTEVAKVRFTKLDMC